MTRANMRRILLAASMATSTAAAGCGQEKTIASKPRPPAPVTIAAAISGDRVVLSPVKIGGGPVLLSVANLSPHTVALKVDPVNAGSGKANTGPISPQGTAQLNVDLSPGTYRVKASRPGFTGAQLTVGPQRRSSQQETQLP